MWFVIALILWAWYLRKLWLGATAGTLLFGKMVGIGIVLVIASLFFVGLASPTTGDVHVEYENATGEESATKGDTDAVVQEDKVTTFLRTLATETRINFSEPTSDNLTWPSKNIALELTNGKSIGAENLSKKDIDAIQGFLLEQGGAEATIGMEFVPPVNTVSSGLVVNNDEYSQLMCIVAAIDNDGVMVGCGFGPGGK